MKCFKICCCSRGAGRGVDTIEKLLLGNEKARIMQPVCGASFDLHFDAFNEYHLDAPRRVPWRGFCPGESSGAGQGEAEKVMSFLVGLPAEPPEKGFASNRMILMPHNIQPDKILNISASIIACCLSARTLLLPPHSGPSLSRQERKKASNQEQNLHEIIFSPPLRAAFLLLFRSCHAISSSG